MDYMDDSRTLDMHIRTLRQKLGAYGKLIETVRNVGYRMESRPMTGKIFRSTLAASLTVLLASLLVITGCLYTYFATVREQQLQTELTLAAAAVESGRRGLSAQRPGTRRSG